MYELCFVVIAKGLECGRTYLGCEFAELCLEGIESLQRSDHVSHQTCQRATQSFRATATAALLRPRRAATARPHSCCAGICASPDRYHTTETCDLPWPRHFQCASRSLRSQARFSDSRRYNASLRHLENASLVSGSHWRSRRK